MTHSYRSDRHWCGLLNFLSLALRYVVIEAEIRHWLSEQKLSCFLLPLSLVSDVSEAWTPQAPRIVRSGYSVRLKPISCLCRWVRLTTTAVAPLNRTTDVHWAHGELSWAWMRTMLSTQTHICTSLQPISLKAENDKQFSRVGALRLLCDIRLARKLDNSGLRLSWWFRSDCSGSLNFLQRPDAFSSVCL